MRSVISMIFSLLLISGIAAAEPQGTFRFAHDLGSGAHSSLDPISKGRVLQITEKMMSRLIRPGADGRPEPDLATGWSANSDGSVWTLTLREGVQFHDGTDFDAADVVYSLNRVLDPEMGSPAHSAVKMMQTVVALDAFTVQINLESTFADLPLQLMDPRLRIIPEGSGDTIGQTGIGTGPFQLEKFDPDGTTILSAFDGYWEGTPKLERMEIIGIPDANTRMQAFLAGQLDMERGLRPLVRRALKRSSKYVVQEIPTGNWSGFVFRTDVAPFNDVRVRRALRLAVDRAEMLKLALDGGGIISCDTPVGPGDQYRSEMSCDRDVEQARALLTEAGYPDGIDVTLHVSSIDASWSPMAVVYQDHAAEAGIRVKIKNASADGYWTEVWMHKDVFATSWGERPADQVLNEAFHSEAKWNESHFNDPRFDHMLARARQELDFAERRNYYIHAQEYLAEHSGTLIPYHRTQLVGLSPRVRNLDPVKSDRVRWHLVDISEENS